MTPIRNEKNDGIGYRQEQPGGQVKIRDEHGELVGWTAFGQTRAKDGTLVSFQVTPLSYCFRLYVASFLTARRFVRRASLYVA